MSLIATVEMRLNSVRLVILRKFIVKVLDYFTEIKRMRSLVSNAATIVAEVASEAVDQPSAQYRMPSLNETKNAATNPLSEVFRYKVMMLNPLLLIPRSSKSLERVIADLGHISVFNRFEPVRHFCIISDASANLI